MVGAGADLEEAAARLQAEILDALGFGGRVAAFQHGEQAGGRQADGGGGVRRDGHAQVKLPSWIFQSLTIRPRTES